MLLPPELRNTFLALWVEGGGNCFWRAVSKALWGAGKYWRQLKLVVLGWCSLNVEALVGESGPLHLNTHHHEEHIHVKSTCTAAAMAVLTTSLMITLRCSWRNLHGSAMRRSGLGPFALFWSLKDLV